MGDGHSSCDGPPARRTRAQERQALSLVRRIDQLNPIVYAISYSTGGPADSLNVAVTNAPSVGTSTDTNIWIDGDPDPGFGDYTPAVQFKAGNGS